MPSTRMVTSVWTAYILLLISRPRAHEGNFASVGLPIRARLLPIRARLMFCSLTKGGQNG